MDPFAIPKYLALVTRGMVKRVGWKAVIVGWILSGIAAVVLQHTI